MKRILSAFLAALTLWTLTGLTGCGGKKKDDAVENGSNTEATVSEPLRLGLGVVVTATASDASSSVTADEDSDGKGNFTVTCAAVLLKKDGSIHACRVDEIEGSVSFTAAGQALTAEAFESKRELGDRYGMTLYGDSKKEWYEQLNLLEDAVKGKTVSEFGSLLTEDGKTGEDLSKAGCTLSVTNYLKALEKAAKDAEGAETFTEAVSSLTVGLLATQSEKTDATADTSGNIAVETTAAATANSKDGKILRTRTDAVSLNFPFNEQGESAFDVNGEHSTKRELGDRYGMTAHGGAAKEWYEQANAFEAACVGKTADTLAQLEGKDGYGDDALQKAGCTVKVAELLRATEKAVGAAPRD